jgi:predicted ATP-dependent serine protease
MVLWECNECGETTRERSRRCPSCGTAGTYNRIRTEQGQSREVESLRELWITAGAERWKPPALTG